MDTHAEFAEKMAEIRRECERLNNENKALREKGQNEKNGESSLVYGLIDLLLILQPNLVISHIASPSFKPSPHFTTHPNATLLFADISGYTALAQALGAAGAHGTEMLSQSLDDFFGTSAR